MGCLIALAITLLLGCGPSRSELFTRFDDCYEQYVRPHDKEAVAVGAIDSFLYGLDPEVTLTVSQFLDLLDIGNLGQYVDIEFSEEELKELIPGIPEFMKELMTTPSGEYTFDFADLSKRKSVSDWNTFLWTVIGEEVSSRGSAMYDFCDERYEDRFG